MSLRQPRGTGLSLFWFLDSASGRLRHGVGLSAPQLTPARLEGAGVPRPSGCRLLCEQRGRYEHRLPSPSGGSGSFPEPPGAAPDARALPEGHGQTAPSPRARPGALLPGRLPQPSCPSRRKPDAVRPASGPLPPPRKLCGPQHGSALPARAPGAPPPCGAGLGAGARRGPAHPRAAPPTPCGAASGGRGAGPTRDWALSRATRACCSACWIRWFLLSISSCSHLRLCRWFWFWLTCACSWLTLASYSEMARSCLSSWLCSSDTCCRARQLAPRPKRVACAPARPSRERQPSRTERRSGLEPAAAEGLRELALPGFRPRCCLSWRPDSLPRAFPLLSPAPSGLT